MAHYAPTGSPTSGTASPSRFDRGESRDSKRCWSVATQYFFLRVLHRLPHGSFLQLSARARYWTNDRGNWDSIIGGRDTGRFRNRSSLKRRLRNLREDCLACHIV